MDIRQAFYHLDHRVALCLFCVLFIPRSCFVSLVYTPLHSVRAVDRVRHLGVICLHWKVIVGAFGVCYLACVVGHRNKAKGVRRGGREVK